MNDIYIHDIKLAAILDALGIPYRKTDPVTCVIETTDSGHRKEQYTFWFDVSADGMRDKAKEYIRAYNAARDWHEYTLGQDHPIYYMKAVLENREVRLNWIRKNVAPQKVITVGDKTILIGEKASQRTRDKMKELAR